MRHCGIPEKFISKIQTTYKGMACRVLHEGKTTDQLDVQTDVRQGSILLPFLFLVAIDRIMRTSTEGQKNGLQWTLWEQLVDLDLALLSHNQKQMQKKTSLIETTAATSGLNVNKDKTKIMKINSSQLHYKEKSLKCDTSGKYLSLRGTLKSHILTYK